MRAHRGEMGGLLRGLEGVEGVEERGRGVEGGGEAVAVDDRQVERARDTRSGPGPFPRLLRPPPPPLAECS